jgi:hypothetical protein
MTAALAATPAVLAMQLPLVLRGLSAARWRRLSGADSLEEGAGVPAAPALAGDAARSPAGEHGSSWPAAAWGGGPPSGRHSQLWRAYRVANALLLWLLTLWLVALLAAAAAWLCSALALQVRPSPLLRPRRHACREPQAPRVGFRQAHAVQRRSGTQPRDTCRPAPFHPQAGASRAADELGRVAGGEGAQRAADRMLQLLRSNYAAIRAPLAEAVQQQLDSAYAAIFGATPAPGAAPPPPPPQAPRLGAAAGPVPGSLLPAAGGQAAACPAQCLDLGALRFLPQELRCICTEGDLREVAQRAGEAAGHLLPALAGLLALYVPCTWLLMLSVAG